MKSHIQSGKGLLELLILTIFGVVMYISQVVMATLPNIELVSFFIIILARRFRWKSLISVYVFVGCEILTYGISIWVINYLYIWAILAVVVCLISKIDNAVVYAVISAIFGLLFGTLTAIPYLFIGGLSFTLVYIANGFVFDLIHCGGNFILTLLLYKPLTKGLNIALKQVK